MSKNRKRPKYVQANLDDEDIALLDDMAAIHDRSRAAQGGIYLKKAMREDAEEQNAKHNRD